MCEPASITAGAAVAGLALNAVSTMSKSADNSQLYIDNGYNANVALAQNYNSLNARSVQEGDKAATESFDVVRGMAEAKGKATAGAGEAGVGGVSFANILNDYEAREGRARGSIDGNYSMAQGQILSEQEAARSRTKALINSTPRPSATGMWADLGANGVKAGLKIFDAYGDDWFSKTKQDGRGAMPDTSGISPNA